MITTNLRIFMCPACGAYMLSTNNNYPEWKCSHVGFNVSSQQWSSVPEITMIVVDEGIQILRRNMDRGSPVTQPAEPT